MVTWIVGGATVLMCVGLVVGAIRSHLRATALAEAASDSTAPTLALNAPAPNTPPVTPSTDTAPSPLAPAAPMSTTDSASAATAAPARAKKVVHVSKPKHAVKLTARH
ncbi:MAG TPA: hypothetical protein VGM44_12365 [Polyangiaceae bacterium]|jgi:hypothetical protein